MNTKNSIIIFTLIFSVVFCSLAFADEGAAKQVKHSLEFEQMKALVGSWEGTGQMHQKEEKERVDYKLTSGDSALVETLFPGTPHEMVSVYHDENGKLVMTHYCMLGNQPKLALIKSKSNELDFDLAKNNTVSPKEHHMHSLQVSFVNSDEIRQTWTSYAEGKKEEASVFNFKRMK
jgi:hypothetical protein